MKKLIFLIILLIPLTLFAQPGRGPITRGGISSINDASTTVFPHQITFSPDGGVSDDGDGSATVNLDTALDGTFLKLDGSNANTTINIGSENFTTTGTVTTGIHQFGDSGIRFERTNSILQLYVNNKLIHQWEDISVSLVLLSDGVSFILLSDGTSKLKLS